MRRTVRPARYLSPTAYEHLYNSRNCEDWQVLQLNKFDGIFT